MVHEKPPRAWQQILIGIGPFLLNTLLGAIIASPAAIPVLQFKSAGPFDYVLIWLGISIAMHAFPSIGDAEGIWKIVRTPSVPMILRVIAAPIVVVIQIVSIGSLFWLDAIYGGLVAMAVPQILITLLA